MPSRKSARSAARPRAQWSLLRAPNPGPEPPGAARASAESRAEAARTKRGGHGGRGGGEASEGGERKGSEERGRGAGQPAPRKPRASTAAPPAARRPGLGFRSGKPAVPGGLTVPSSGEKVEGGRGVTGGEGLEQGEREEDHRSRRAPRRDCWSLLDPARHPTRRARRGGPGSQGGRSPRRNVDRASAGAVRGPRWSQRCAWWPCGLRGPPSGAFPSPSRCRHRAWRTSRRRCGCRPAGHPGSHQ